MEARLLLVPQRGPERERRNAMDNLLLVVRRMPKQANAIMSNAGQNSRLQKNEKINERREEGAVRT